jgi:hypothetical protein
LVVLPFLTTGGAAMATCCFFNSAIGNPAILQDRRNRCPRSELRKRGARTPHLHVKVAHELTDLRWSRPRKVYEALFGPIVDAIRGKHRHEALVASRDLVEFPVDPLSRRSNRMKLLTDTVSRETP